jgi:hypothetical protein
MRKISPASLWSDAYTSARFCVAFLNQVSWLAKRDANSSTELFDTPTSEAPGLTFKYAADDEVVEEDPDKLVTEVLGVVAVVE